MIPTQLQLFKPGPNKTLKVDPKKNPEGLFFYDTSMIDQIKFNQETKDVRKGRLPIDVAHLSLKNSSNPDSHVAVGWFDLRADETGIWADNIEWTSRGKRYLEEKEFAWFSPAFVHDDQNRIVQIINNSITNEPASLDIEPMIMASNEPTTDETRRIARLEVQPIPLFIPETPKETMEEEIKTEKQETLAKENEEDQAEALEEDIDVVVEEPEKEEEPMDEKDKEIARLNAELQAQVEKNAELQAQLDEILKEQEVADVEDPQEKEILKRLDLASLKALSKIRIDQRKKTEFLSKDQEKNIIPSKQQVKRATVLSKSTPVVDSMVATEPQYKYFKVPSKEQIQKMINKK